MSKEIKPLPEASAIRRVTTYTAAPVECCDRCGQGIKYVALVSLKDGTAMKYGMDCINKILAGDTSLKGLFKKNEKRLAALTETLRVLRLPEAEMPIDPKGYYDRGFYFLAGAHYDGRSYFHPTRVDVEKAKFTGAETFDMRGIPGSEKLPHHGAWMPYTLENWAAKCRGQIAKDIPKIEADIEKLSGFLARIVAKGLAVPSVPSAA